MIKSKHCGSRKRYKKRSSHIVAQGITKQTLTKIDVAESLIDTAVQLFFQDADPIPIYLMAATAREILTTLGDKGGVETVLHAIAKREGKAPKELWATASPNLGFFKHADRNPTATLEFAESEIDAILACACQDFGRVTGGMPISAQIFEVWVYALAFSRVSDAPRAGQRVIKLAIRQFPGIRTANRATQKQLGLALYNRVKNDPALQMEYSREVELAVRGEKAVDPSTQEA